MMEENTVDPLKEYFKDISALVKLIDRKQEAELWVKAKKGSKSAREKLTQMHLRLVVPTAKRFQRRGVELMDLIEEGNLGLLQAIEKFEPSKGYRFSTYAIHWIEQYIRRAMEEQCGTIKIPAHAWDNLRAWGKTWESLKAKLGCEPSLQEMAAKMKLSARQVRSILDTLNAAYSVDSLSSCINEDDDSTLEDTLADYGKSNPDDLVSDAANNQELLSILDEIPSRDKEILIMRFGINSENPLTLSDISNKLGISRERVRQIEERAVRTVRKRAQQLGLFEMREKTFNTTKVHAGMEIKTKKNILGEVIGMDKISKLIKKTAALSAANKIADATLKPNNIKRAKPRTQAKIQPKANAVSKPKPSKPKAKPIAKKAAKPISKAKAKK